MATAFVSTKSIPKAEGTMMAIMLYESISDYFMDPIHKKEFEKWKSEKDKPQIRREK